MYPEKKGGSHKMARPQQNWGLLTLLTRWASIWTMPNTASPKSEPPCGRALYTTPAPFATGGQKIKDFPYVPWAERCEIYTSRGICTELVGANLIRNKCFFIDFQSVALQLKDICMAICGTHARAWGSVGLSIMKPCGAPQPRQTARQTAQQDRWVPLSHLDCFHWNFMCKMYKKQRRCLGSVLFINSVLTVNFFFWLEKSVKLIIVTWFQVKRHWFSHCYSELILVLCPANERRHYKVTPSLIGWAQSQNQRYYCTWNYMTSHRKQPRPLADAHINFNSLRPSEAIWWHRSGSTLAQVRACCLTAPGHYLNQCWYIISEVWWHFSEDNSQ